jgi:SNF2 family DNA or RNA helicase
LFTLMEGMDTFNELPPQDMDGRMLQWAGLKELLPEDVLVDDNLRSINIVRADSFTLDLDDSGAFSPLLLHQGHQEQFEDEAVQGKPVLPQAPQRDFEKRFRQQSEARRRYTTSGNWFVVLPENLHKTLQVVREYQSKPVQERLAFLANPQAVLKEKLQGVVEEKLIDDLFEETPEFLSERVERLGEWQPKACAYLMPSTQSWLPPEDRELGIPVGNAMYTVPIKDIPTVARELEQAHEEGKSEIQYNGQTIAVTDEAIDAFKKLSGVKPDDTVGEGESLPDGEEAQTEPAIEQLVPILFDNIEDVGYKAKPRKIRGAPGGLPDVLRTTSLYPHQKDGLRWLQDHWACGSTGGLLADDMGLGKTLQTLAFLGWVQEQMDSGMHPKKPMLIVAPTGLLKNWQDEAEIHLDAPGLGRLYRAFGSELRELKSLSHAQRIARIQEVDWVVTTYETLRDKIRYFTPIDWAVVAYDEVQKIKNPASRMTEMAKSIKADYFLALTGTPVENRLADLWSIIDAVAPGELGSLKEFHTKYEKGSENDSSVLLELKSKLTDLPKPVRMLRRMKEGHLKGLPEKNEFMIEREMPPEQAAAYDQLVGSSIDPDTKMMAILQLLQGFRKVSLLPGELGGAGLTDQDVAASARLSAMVEILDQVRDRGEKALVFVEFLSVQDALIPYLQKRYQMASPPLRISGAVAGHKRKAHVDKFQQGPQGQFDVMLLSPKAGGVGLTLTAANNVIHLSRWWNPAVEDQCTDRVYRIGQEKNVNVYYPLAVHPRYREASFDMNLHALLERKRALSREVLTPGIASNEDVRDLFSKTVTR